MTGPRRLALLLSLLLLTGATTFALIAGGTDIPRHGGDDAHEEDTAICRVHNQRLVREEMRIIYGLPAFNRAAQAAFTVSDTLFPHAVPHIFGGCVIDESSPLTRTVHYCPSCRIARSAWIDGFMRGMADDAEQ